MKTYEKTHPWLSFHVDLRRVEAGMWIALGECQSKCQHISGMPLTPKTSEELHRIYLAKGVSATTAIEGNTLTEEQIQKQLEGELRLPASKDYLARETQNIIDMCNLIGNRLEQNDPPPLSPGWIKQLNRAVLTGLELAPEVEPGEVRRHSVGVMHYRGAPARDCEYLLQRLCEWLSGPVFNPSAPGLEIVYSIIKAVLAHLYIAWIHPFGDGNGRTARLLEFQILLSSGVPSPAAHLLSNHYNQTRSEYYRQLDRASRSGGDVHGFLLYAVQGLRDQLKEQIDRVREMQIDIMWRDYVHETFRGESSAAGVRRRNLALAVTSSRRPASREELAGLTPEVAVAYAGKNEKTLSRDIDLLLKMKLIRKQNGGYVACKERILAFLPFQAAGACGPQ